MPRTPAPAARLLAATLRPERRAVAGILGVLVVTMGLRLATPVLLGRFVDDATNGKPTSALTHLALLYIAAALVAECLQLAVIWGSVKLSWRAGNRLRERLAHHALRLDLSWHARHSPGQLIERIDGDVEAMGIFFANVVVEVLGNAVLVVGMVVVAFVIDVRAGAVLLAIVVLGTTLLVRQRAAAVPAREAEREANAILYGDLEERLGGLEDLRANGAGRYAVHRLHGHSARTWKAARYASLRGDSAYAICAIAFAGGSIATLALGFTLHQRGIVTVGAVVSLFRFSDMLRQPLERIAEQMKEFQKAFAGARRAATMLATESTVADGWRDDLPAGPLTVELDGVTFSYRAGTPVLRSIDLRLAPGHHVGLIGRTGSGKTTLGRLLLRFWDVDEGSVRVGGIDVRELELDVLRRRIAVVTQDVELFDTSLRDNLTLFGARRADDGRLRSVLRQVGLGEWFDALPRGLDSHVSGRGGLSAGEGQLLAFARAFLLDPDVVVLDEASSRLDPVTEARIATATHALLDGRSALVIAHRLATLDDVDEIVVLHDGEVTERGDRLALAADPSSRYARLLLISGAGLLVDEVLA
ncbi:MAG: ATP-binding cassette, subfamily bacterial [Actinomycetota bacterium]|nr:ATP-binding cassette, subfamily bacterial [Actinomycetota bacterium]